MPQDQTPEATKGFGAREDADASRQAQHGLTNDTPVDVNRNAMLAAEQARTTAQMGNEFTAGAARRDAYANAIMAKLTGSLKVTA